MMQLASGHTPSGMYFSYITSVGNEGEEQYKGAGLFSVELPFMSAAHIVGVAKNSAIPFTIAAAKTAMQPMRLEGNYEAYFDLYVESTKQVDGRYILDPKAMSFTIDFCRHYHWEIIDDYLYFLNRSSAPSLEMIDQFVKEIRPAVDSKKPVVHNPALRPYGVLLAQDVKCPICHQLLGRGSYGLECPQQHGILVTGKQFIDVRTAHTILAPDTTLDYIEADRQLVCPNCQHQMRRAQYQQLPIFLDICPKCPYRWIDAAEMKAVLGVSLDSTQKVDHS